MGSAHLLPEVPAAQATHVVAVGTDNEPKRVPIADVAGGGGGTVELTQAEFDALGTPDPDTTYIITDAGPLYVTQAEFDAIATPDPNRLYVVTDRPGDLYELSRSLIAGPHASYPTYLILPGEYIVTGGAAEVLTKDEIRYVPFVIDHPITVTAIGYYINTGQVDTSVRTGIVPLNDDLTPKATGVVELGNHSTVAAGWMMTQGLNLTLPPGRYARLMRSEGGTTQPTLYGPRIVGRGTQALAHIANGAPLPMMVGYRLAATTPGTFTDPIPTPQTPMSGNYSGGALNTFGPILPFWMEWSLA